jgi:hypothetical protein
MSNPPVEINVESSHSATNNSNNQQQHDESHRSAFHTAITTPMELINEFHDTSFWNIAPRWNSSGFGLFSTGRSGDDHYDDDSESIWNGDREVVYADDDDDDDDTSLDPTHIPLGDRLRHYCSSSNNANVLKFLWMGAILVTGLVLTITLTKNVQHVNLSEVLSFRRSKSYRYAAMKEMLVNVSSVEVLDMEDSAQHRALVFLADNDPLVLVSLFVIHVLCLSTKLLH